MVRRGGGVERDDLAIVYNDKSVLEQMHLTEFFKLLKRPECNVFAKLTRAQYTEARKAMKEILSEIQEGKFADEWLTEHRCGQPHFRELRKEGEHHPIEEVGARLRGLMPWMKSDRLVDKSKN